MSLKRLPYKFQLQVKWIIITIFCICNGNTFEKNITSENNQNDHPEDEQFESQIEEKQAIRFNYALDPTETKRLALTEEHLISAFSELLKEIPATDENHLCYTYLHKYLSEFNQDFEIVNRQKGILRANMVTDNPNLTLKMIRRLVVTLLNETRKWCEKPFPHIGTIINETFTAVILTLPIQDDLDDALEGLLRIQFVYGLNATSEIRQGIFQDVKTGAYLDFHDCMALAKKAIQMGGEAMAYQWLVSATLNLLELKNQRDFETKQYDLEEAWLNLQELTNVKNLSELHNLLGKKRQESFHEFLDYEVYATCRGEMQIPLANRKHRLLCFYQTNWDPYFYINPVKTQVLSIHPLVIQFFNFIGDQTIDFIRSSVREYMLRSSVVPMGSNESIYTPVRTSMNAWLPDKNGTQSIPKLLTLSRRLEKLSGLEVHKDRASQSMQVAMYGALGGHYDFHLDSLQVSGKYSEETGDRLATFLIFLNDVRLGGYTAFPFAGTFAKPEKGSAILWYNIYLNGTENVATLHGGCPVILGTKEVANRCILQFENMFRERCSLRQDK